MDQVTQQNAAMVEQTTAASHSLSEEPTKLARQLGFFDTGRQHTHDRPPPRQRRPEPVGAPAPRPREKRAVNARPQPGMGGAEEGWAEF